MWSNARRSSPAIKSSLTRNDYERPMTPGHPYDQIEHDVLGLKDRIHNRVPFIFSPASRIAGVDIALVGTQGDAIYTEVKGLVRSLRYKQRIIRLRFVLAKRYAPERKEVIAMCGNRADANRKNCIAQEIPGKAGKSEI